MIQLRLVRTFTPRGETKEKKYDKALDQDVCSPTVKELFENLAVYLDQIPQEDRWNCFYTIGHTPGGKTREFVRQDVLPIDVDGIDVKEDGGFDERYLTILHKTLKLDPAKTVAVFSGNGLQLLIALDGAIHTDKYFEENKKAYKLLMSKLAAQYLDAGLKAKLDTAVFAPNWLFRLPGTENRKPGKPVRVAKIIQQNLEPQGFDLMEAAGLVKEKKQDSLTEEQLSYFKIDTAAVLDGCNFLKWTKENQGDVTEPLWYAALSIIGRLEKGEDLAQEYSENHPSYSADETSQKLVQAVERSGPRTCDNINSLWGSCRDCPHYNKVNSPVSIKGDAFIATEDFGFYLVGPKGQLSPQYEDLRRYLNREHGYVTHEKTGTVYIFDGRKYIPWSEFQLKHFAHNAFNPKPLERVVHEFSGWLSRTNLVPPSFFSETILGRINFDNGILNIKTGELEPHTKDLGFLYVLPYSYQPNATSPQFDALMQRVTCGDKELEELLLEFTGYAICDNGYWLQKAVLLKGEGANGKSTYLDIVRSLAGSENVASLSLYELQNETSRSMLEGKLLNISDEMPNYGMRSTETFKKIMGGVVTMRRLYHDSTSVQNTAKFFFSCNDIPPSTDTSDGLFRRITIIPFNAVFPEKQRDHKISDKMKLELPGIFNRVFGAYKRLLDRGHLVDAAEAHKELQNYREANDIVGEWVRNNVEILPLDDKNESNLRDMYAQYHSDAIRYGEKPTTRNRFTAQLKRHIPEFDKRYHRAKRIGKEVLSTLVGVRVGKVATVQKEEPKPEPIPVMTPVMTPAIGAKEIFI